MERLTLEGVRIIHVNFRGEERQYNPPGSRVFSVLIEDLDTANELLTAGWNLKPLYNPDESDEVSAFFLPVKINYESNFPPRIYKVTRSTGQSLLLNEDTIDMLDYLSIEYVDVILNPYRWTVREDSGVKAYVQTMYVVIDENALDLKWANIAPFEADEE